MMNEIKISNKITAEQIEADSRNKHIRKLKKQLREISLLEEKIADGTISNPEKQQLDKISKKGEILEELEKMGEPLD
jgi:partner of Y14 and mago